MAGIRAAAHSKTEPSPSASDGSAGPLSDQARTIAQDLRNALQTLLKALPRSGTSTLSLSHDLGVDRNLTQQVVTALAVDREAVEVLGLLPGLAGLNLFIEAAAKITTQIEDAHAAHEVMKRYQELVDATGGSRARLLRHLQAQGVVQARPQGSATPPITESQESRIGHGIYQQARELLRYHVECDYFVTAIRSMTDQPSLIEGAYIRALAGLTASGGQLPLMTERSAMTMSDSSVIPESRMRPLVDQPSYIDGLLEGLSSQPFPSVISRENDGTITQSIDFDETLNQRPIDVAFGNRWAPISNPMLASPRIFGQTLRVKHPSASILIDVYWHRSLATRSIPRAVVFSGSNPMTPGDRLPIQPRIELLGLGTSKAATQVWSRGQEATDLLFSELGWPAADFVGYRCEIRYPIWGATYCLMFEFEQS